MFEDIGGARAVMIAGETSHDHDMIMKKVVQRAAECNLRLNFDKREVKQPKMNYVGHLVTGNCLEQDAEKIRAVRRMPIPRSKEDIRIFLGCVLYLSKCIPNVRTVAAPFRELMTLVRRRISPGQATRKASMNCVVVRKCWHIAMSLKTRQYSV